MARQRAAARKAWAGSGEAATEAQWFELRERLGATEFLGYDSEVAEGVVTAILLDGQEVQQAPAGSEVALHGQPDARSTASPAARWATAASRSPPTGCRVAVNDIQKKLGDLLVHYGTVEHGTLEVGEAVELRVDGVRRAAPARPPLGDPPAARGAAPAARRPRHPEGLAGRARPAALRLQPPQAARPPRTSRSLEAEVNGRIRCNAAVTTRLMTPDEAIDAGALALFGEKYGDEVRVVSMGGRRDPQGSRPALLDRAVRRHPCPAHRRHRPLQDRPEQALAAGVRRIEAVTGAAALAHVERQEALLGEAASALRAAPAELPQRIAALLEERKRLERELAELRRKLATGGGGRARRPSEINGVTFAARVVEDVPARDLKSMADDLKQQIGSGVVALVAVSEGKASLVVGVTDDLTGRSRPSTWCAPARPRSAARAAAAGPTWPRPAAPTAPRPRRRSPPSRSGARGALGRPEFSPQPLPDFPRSQTSPA